MSKLTPVDVQHLQAAAVEVLKLLNSLQTRFQSLANTESCAMDQTLVATHACGYADLAYLLGTIPQQPDVRAALSTVGLLPVFETHLSPLATTVKPRLYVPGKKVASEKGTAGLSAAAA